MIINSLVDQLNKLGIREGDTLCVSSDIGRIGIPTEVKSEIKRRGMAALTDAYIETLLSTIGSSGTLIMPTFTYSGCEGEVFDIKNTPSKVGMLTEAFRKYPSTIRNEHPIFSFAFHGYRAKQLATIQNFDCFGDSSVYDQLYHLNAKYLMLGVNMWQGSTYVYYSEQKYGVPYRYMKNFDTKIVSDKGQLSVVTPYFVRDYEVGYEDAWDQLQKDSIEQGISRSQSFLAGHLIIHKAKDIDSFIRTKLAENSDYLIRYV